VSDVLTDLELSVEDLTVRFGGVTAVNGVSLHVPAGKITGLIGPNGAGKTTTFGACTGLVRASAGRVHLGGVDVTGLPPHRRAQLGMGRTFQRMQLFDSVNVRANVELGREALLSGNSPLRHLWSGRRVDREVAQAADDAMGLCGISHLAGAAVADLSTGQRRLVELARVVAGGFRLLLLDEPSSGLDVAETEAFGQVLLELAQQRGLGILLVEHDMSLVMRVCSYLYVIDFGVPIFDGTPEQTQASHVVRQAYLGEDA
jgi:ABC-type branched-subunit amino acid transport system ATPase component